MCYVRQNEFHKNGRRNAAERETERERVQKRKKTTERVEEWTLKPIFMLFYAKMCNDVQIKSIWHRNANTHAPVQKSRLNSYIGFLWALNTFSEEYVECDAIASLNDVRAHWQLKWIRALWFKPHTLQTDSSSNYIGTIRGKSLQSQRQNAF